MPFVTPEKIKPFIPNGVAVALAKEGVFTQIESEAAFEIRDLSGLPIPSDHSNAPDWIALPAARLIAKLALRLVSDWSPETISSIENDYKLAREDLRKRRNTESTEGENKSVVDTFEGEEVW